jgi:tRNA A37 methylthiotransferase MiaB
MSNPLADAISQGMAKSFAARMDPDRPAIKEFTAIQMSQFRDEAVDSRMTILEQLEKKIEVLKASMAEGRTLEVYIKMHETLGSQIVGPTR